MVKSCKKKPKTALFAWGPLNRLFPINYQAKRCVALGPILILFIPKNRKFLHFFGGGGAFLKIPEQYYILVSLTTLNRQYK